MAGLAPLLLFTACNDEKKADAASRTPSSEAVKAAQARLSQDSGTEVALRGIQVYSQAKDGMTAVCGQVKVNPQASGAAFTLFVSVAAEKPGESRLSIAEQYIATDGASASRVFIETLRRCYTDGGPTTTQRASAPPPMPPVPEHLPDIAQAAPPPPASPNASQIATQASTGSVDGGRVTMTQNGNLRSHPNGGGDVLRVISQGADLQVFGQAPGGWLQVGDKEPWGWIHGSLVNR